MKNKKIKRLSLFVCCLCAQACTTLSPVEEVPVVHCDSIQTIDETGIESGAITKLGCHVFEAIHGEDEITASAISLHIIKNNILSEIGTYIESESILERASINGDYKSNFTANVKAITGGIVKTEIIEQRWLDKKHTTYYLKAKVTVDGDEIAEKIAKITQNKGLMQELTESRRQIDGAFREINTLQKKLSQKISPEIEEYYKDQVNILLAEELYQKGEAFLFEHEFSKALAAFEQVLRLNPEHARSYAGRAFARMAPHTSFDKADKKDLIILDAAIKDYNTAIRLDPEVANARDNLALIYNTFATDSFKNKEYPESIRLLDIALNRMANKGSDKVMSIVYQNRAVAYTQLEQYREAIRDCNQAIHYRAEYIDAYMQKVRIYNSMLIHGDKSVLNDLRNNLIIASLLGHANARALYNQNFKPPIRWADQSKMIIGAAMGSNNPRATSQSENYLKKIGFPIVRVKGLLQLALMGDREARGTLKAMGVDWSDYTITQNDTQPAMDTDKRV